MESRTRSKLITISFGLLGILFWIVLFALGLLIDSKPYRASLLQGFKIDDFFISIITYTPTNLIVLCLFAAFTGGCASKLIYLGLETNAQVLGITFADDKSDSQFYMNENPFGSMLRGLTVYFIFLTGTFLASSDPFNITSALQYAKSAGSVSLLSFIVGYDPTVFKSLLNLTNRVKSKG